MLNKILLSFSNLFRDKKNVKCFTKALLWPKVKVKAENVNFCSKVFFDFEVFLKINVKLTRISAKQQIPEIFNFLIIKNPNISLSGMKEKNWLAPKFHLFIHVSTPVALTNDTPLSIPKESFITRRKKKKQWCHPYFRLSPTSFHSPTSSLAPLLLSLPGPKCHPNRFHHFLNIASS